MARKVKEGERAARIDEILDAAQALIQTKGYEQMTIQDLLDALGISKGAFYHYFGSKQALLEALVERMVEQVTAVLWPLLDDARMPALHKLEAVLGVAAGWKAERIDLLAQLIRVWYADENHLVREKLGRAAMGRFRTLLEAIIRQGIDEGIVTVDYPDMAGSIALELLRGMSEEIVRCLMAWDQLPDGPGQIARCIAAYTNAIEDLLGVAHGTLCLVDPAIFAAWSAALSER